MKYYITCCLVSDVIRQTDGNNQHAHQEIRKRHADHQVKGWDTHASTNPHETAYLKIPDCGKYDQKGEKYRYGN